MEMRANKRFAPDFVNGGAGGIQVRRSIKLELSFAVHGFDAVRVVKAHNNFFRDAAALFRTNERFWLLYECMGVTSAMSISRRYYSRSRVSPTCCQNFGHFNDMSKFNYGTYAICMLA